MSEAGTQVGAQIRRLRKAKGWTVAQLAVYADMSPSAVSQIETGRRSPTAASMLKLAEALGAEVRDFFPLAQPRARSAAEGHLTVRGTLEDIEENLSSDQLIEILEGVWNRRITVDTAASRLKPLVKEPA